MAGVELNLAHSCIISVEPTCGHELQRPLDPFGYKFVAFADGARCDEFLVPVMDLSKIRVDTASEGTQQIQSRRRSVVSLKQSFRVRCPRILVEGDVVDYVTAKTREG